MLHNFSEKCSFYMQPTSLRAMHLEQKITFFLSDEKNYAASIKCLTFEYMAALQVAKINFCMYYCLLH